MSNEFCHNGMKCQQGCPCAGKDGVCHCSMVSVKNSGGDRKSVV